MTEPVAADGVADDTVAERARAAADNARHTRDAALRATVSDVLARADSMRGMLQGCTEALVTHLDTAFARIWTLRRGSDVLELQASAGAYTRLNGTYARVRVGELKIGLIALERTPYLTNDVLVDPRIADKEWARRAGIVAFAGYPLVVEERVVGVMAMFARHALDSGTMEVIASVASAIAQGIERKRSEEDLRRSEAYLVEGQRLSHTGSWAWNLITGERYWSREMYRINGFTPADAPPPIEVVLQRIHPDDVGEVRRAIGEALRTGTEFGFRHRIRTGDRPIKWVETYGHPVRDDDGRVVEFIGTIVDVTERMRASRRLRHAIKARYEAVLAERTRIARDMHDGLLQDIAGIALQLGAMLPHIRTSPDVATERLKHILESIERTSREAREAVVGMRVVAESTDLVSAVQSAAQHVTERAALALTVRVTGRARPVPAPVRDVAVSIVHEAVTNVLKHAGAQAVDVVVTFRRKRLRLSVRDDGRGLAAPEEHAGQTQHCGLMGMRERAADIGASFSVRSMPGKGTAVSLDLPYGR